MTISNLRQFGSRGNGWISNLRQLTVLFIYLLYPFFHSAATHQHKSVYITIYCHLSPFLCRFHTYISFINIIILSSSYTHSINSLYILFTSAYLHISHHISPSAYYTIFMIYTNITHIQLIIPPSDSIHHPIHFSKNHQNR